ncbi:Uncharacterised protein [Escherichia coli]|nr:Uncharacterised protein [Escherichia coli]
MHKSENEKIDFILDEHERISRKQGSLCMALGKGFLVIAILCGVATFCVSGLYLKSLCLSVACCCGVFSRIFNYYSVPEECKRAARTVLTGMCYSVGSATRQGSSSPTRFIGQSAMTSRT